MYLGYLEIGSQETVVEYDQHAIWRNWQIERPSDGETIVYLGKFALMHTKSGGAITGLLIHPCWTRQSPIS